MQIEADVQVLVVGAGACGLSAAIAAHDAGASVAIIEKLVRAGGNSSLSTGSVPAAGSKYQIAAGIVDDPARMVRDLLAIAGGTEEPELVHRMAEVSAPTVEWLIDELGARMQLITAYKHVGHSVPRLHAPISRRGQDLVDDLLSFAEARSIPIAVGNGADRLIVEDGAVRGVIVKDGGAIYADKVILAVNGYAGNRALVERFCPEIVGAAYFGALGSTGEAVTWGEQVGAGLSNMAAYQGYAAVSHPHGTLLSWTTIEKGGLILNCGGRRFGDESVGYSGFAREVLLQGGFCFAVFDQRVFDIASQEEEFAELASYGGLRQAGSAAEIAQMFGLDPAATTDTLAAFNRAAVGADADPFGRKDFGLAPLESPFYGCRVVPGLFHTQGGLKVGRDAEVLRADGMAVPNLFAGGGAAAGISGQAGAMGYASGNGLLTAIALGRLAGLEAARQIGATSAARAA